MAKLFRRGQRRVLSTNEARPLKAVHGRGEGLVDPREPGLLMPLLPSLWGDRMRRFVEGRIAARARCFLSAWKTGSRRTIQKPDRDRVRAGASSNREDEESPIGKDRQAHGVQTCQRRCGIDGDDRRATMSCQSPSTRQIPNGIEVIGLASGLSRERVKGRLALALCRLVCRHMRFRLVLVRLRFLYFLFEFLTFKISHLYN